MFSCYRSIKGYYTSGILTKILEKCYNRSDNSNFPCMSALTIWTMILSPLSSTDKDHYHLVPKVLPLLRGPIHLGSAHVGDLPNAEVFILCEFRTFSSSLTRIFCNLYLAIFNLIVLADETTFMMQSVIWFHRPSINMLIHISFFLYQQRCDGRT